MSRKSHHGKGDGAWFLPRACRNLRTWLAMLSRPPRNASPALAPVWPLTGRLLLWACGLGVLITAVMVLADAWAITAGRSLPHGLRTVFGDVTGLGKAALFLYPLGVALVLLAAVDWTRMRGVARGVAAAIIVRIGFLFVAIGASTLFTAIAKHVVGRARPFVTGQADPYVYAPFSWSEAYASFPSGHATAAFAVAVAAACLWPRARPALLFYVLVIAVSRVVLSAHHPSDVIAGAIIGTVGALTARSWFASRRLGFSVNADGAVVRLPGPSWRRVKALARTALWS